jgi:hypothetical protein
MPMTTMTQPAATATDTITGAGQSRLLGRRLSLRDLPGFGRKWLSVPEGQEGIVVGGDRQREVLPPGRHLVVVWRDRLFGNVAGLQLGLLATRAFTVVLDAGPLLNGDGELVDLRCILTLRVLDPVPFFIHEVAGTRQVTLAGVGAWLSELVREKDLAASWVAPYAGSALQSGEMRHTIGATIQRQLDALLGFSGLAVQAVEDVIVRPTEDRLLRREKLAAFEQRVQAQAVQSQIAKLHSAGEWQAWLKTALTEAGVGGDVDLALLAQRLTSGEQKQTPWPELIQQCTRAPEPKGTLLARLRRRLNSAPTDLDGTRPTTAWWWLPPVLKFVIVLLFGAAIVALAVRLSEGATPFDKLIGMLDVLAFAVPLIWGAFWGLIQAQNRISEEAWAQHGQTHLDVLSQGNRALADRLVREQIGGDLAYLAQTLRDARRQVYARGDPDEALALKAVEQRLERLLAETRGGAGGQAPYLSAARVSEHEFRRMLDLDEDLLVQSAVISQDGKRLLKVSLEGNATSGARQAIEARLVDFGKQWAERARFLQTPAAVGGE